MPLDQLPGTFFGPSNLVDLLRHRLHHQPDDVVFTFLVDGETQQVHMTYRELDRQARAIAAWLESLGLVGERALLLYPTNLEFIAAFFGCLYAGVTAVPIYPPRRNRFLSRIQAIAADADAKVALTTDAVFRRVKPLAEQTPGFRELTWLATCNAPEEMERRWEKPDVHADTLAFLQYTSGSTGTPKGVMLTHANLMHNSALIAYVFEHTRSGLGVFWLPAYHDMGLIGGILQPLYMGCPNILMAPMAFLQRPYRWLSAISRYGGTTSGGPNFAYDLCVRKITPEQRKTLDLSSWDVAFNGAEPVREETIERFVEAFGPCGFRREAFFPCYGLAEATLIVSGGFAKDPPRVRAFEAGPLTTGQVVDGEPDDEGARQLVGCGVAMRDEKILIVDPESMTRCPADQIGEVWVAGPSVAQGYWRQPQTTNATFKAYEKNTGEGPFLRTGDLGFLRDGELFVTGRLKDVIIVHGLNHYPQDIELSVAKSHPRLRADSGAAFAVEEDGREKLVVVQEVERRTKDGLEEIFAAIRQAVAEEHELAVDAVVLIKAGSVPKTSSGKIQRHACCDAYCSGSLTVVGRWDGSGKEDEPLGGEGTCVSPTAQTPEPRVIEARLRPDRPVTVRSNGDSAPAGETSPAAEAVLNEVRRVAKERAAGLTLDTPITQLGMDSLERVEILASIEERFGGRFPEEILLELETCGQVVEAVEKYLGGQPRPKTDRPADAEIPTENYRIDEFPECRQLRESLGMAEQFGIENPYFRVHQSFLGARTVVGGRELINYSAFNYLEMSCHPAVMRAAKEAVDRYGTSVSASRLVSGERDLLLELERTIARFIGTEDAIAFVSGHSTNESVIGHLFGPGDLILHDGLSHNSIVQGAVLSGARRRPFTHNDPQAVDKLLGQLRHEYRRVLIVIEGVYSMDGDVPDLPKFIEVKRRHKALLMIDEAHSIGILGTGGRGIGELFDVDRSDVELWMGSLSKGLGSCGGYIAGSKELVQYLKYTAPSFVFAAGISPPNAAAAKAAIEVIQADPQRVQRLRDRSAMFLALAGQHGLNTGTSQGTPVVPIILGSSVDCLRASQAMFQRGVNVQPILYPAVEESAARLRFFINSEHTEDEILYTVDTLVEELEKIDPAHLGRSPEKEVPSPESIK